MGCLTALFFLFFLQIIQMTITLPKSSHPTGLHFFKRNPHPKKEDHGDCAVRAIALATDTEYWLVKRYADDAINAYQNDIE